MSEHRLVGQQCSCGAKPRLGDIVWRWFDRHLLEMRELVAEAVGSAGLSAPTLSADDTCTPGALLA